MNLDGSPVIPMTTNVINEPLVTLRWSSVRYFVQLDSSDSTGVRSGPGPWWLGLVSLRKKVREIRKSLPPVYITIISYHPSDIRHSTFDIWHQILSILALAWQQCQSIANYLHHSC